MSKQKKIKVNRLFNSHFTSIISISLVLFLIGLGSLLLLLSADLSVYVKENIRFSIVLNQDVKDAEVKRLQKNLDVAPYVKSTEYITKEQAIQDLSEELGEDPTEFLGFNPLLASLEVKLNYEYANADSIAMIESELKNFPQIKEVIYQRNLIEMVNQNVQRITTFLPIRLTVYSKRFLISTMKLVGANWSFIRRPFVLRNILNGIIASVLAMGLLTLGLYYVQEEWHDIIRLSNLHYLPIIYGVILFFGIFITMISAYFSVNRYLRLKADDLYYL